jgi:DnaJ-class molecular chaperone
MTDFYAILDLPNSASADEVKKSYRQLAKKYHPDKNLESTAESEKIFKKISEAYDTLSDPYKKKKYDQRYRNNRPRFFFTSTTPVYWHSGFQKNLFEDRFAIRPQQAPANVNIQVKCTKEELYTGTTKIIKVVRKRLSNQKLLISENKTFELRVKPGWKHGTKITFRQQGDQTTDEHTPASDILFVIV